MRLSSATGKSCRKESAEGISCSCQQMRDGMLEMRGPDSCEYKHEDP